jgi:hypothetical protein
MKTPLKILRERRREIYSEYLRVRSVEYGGSNTSPNNKYKQAFESCKKEDVDKIKAVLDEYDEAINILYTIKNETFEF